MSSSFSNPEQPPAPRRSVGRAPESADLSFSNYASDAPVIELEAMEQFAGLDPRNIQVEQIAGLILGTVVTVALLVGMVIVWLNVGLGWILSLVVGVGAFVVAAIFWLVYQWPKIDYRHAQYRIDEEGLEIRRGVFWRHRVAVPLGRVQHADVSQGPLQRMFHLGTLTVHTAGTHNASVALEGLEHAHAMAIRDLIVRQRNDQDAV